MVKENVKKYHGIGLYQEDWTRIRRNLQHRETKIDFIEEAIQLLFDVREGRAKVSRMSSLA